MSREPLANMVKGMLIVEDMLGIILIALLTGIARTGALQSWEAFTTVGELAVFLVVSLVLGLIAVPRIIGFVARFRSAEMLLISVLALCFGFTLITVKLGYSLALGAFLVGAFIAESKEISKVEHLMTPLRDMFSAVFFVSVGLLIEPAVLQEYWLPIIVITLTVIFGVIPSVTFGAYVAGQDLRTALRTGMSMAQIGEFSFIIASLGLTLGVTSSFLFPIAVSVSALTTLTTPYLIKHSDPFTAWLERSLPPTLLSYANLYHRWLGQFRRGRQNSQVRQILRRIAGQLLVFMGLIAGAMLAAVFLSRVLLRYVPATRAWEGAVHSALWLAATLAAMPVYIAAYRKLKALGMILAELGITDAMGGERKVEVRAVVANTILVFGLIAMGLFTFALGYAMLPPVSALVIMAVAVAVMSYRLRGSFNKIYFQGKAALSETFAKSVEEGRKSGPVTDLLREARLEILEMQKDMPGAGRALDELELKTRTGVFVVGIDREGRQILNPEGHEYLRAGDHVLLLGNHRQLQEALQFLAGRGSPPEEEMPLQVNDSSEAS